MVQARKSSKIKYIGISGHKPWIVQKALEKYNFDVIEIPLNFIETSCLNELVPFAQKRGIGIVAMKPIAGGALKGIKQNLRFILTKGADVAIPGMDSIKQITENCSVLDNITPLTASEIKALEQEKKELGEHFCRRCEYCMPCPEDLPISFLHTLQGYYFRYNLKAWTMERINSLPKSFKDCIECGQCISKCPYDLDSPKIFRDTWKKIRQDQNI